MIAFSHEIGQYGLMNGTFSPHLALAKCFWTERIKPGNAACGNGHDTLFLAQLLFPLP